MAQVKINPQIYPLEAIYIASYCFLEEFYIKIEGDPKKQVIVFIEPKIKSSQKRLARVKKEFLNELNNAALRLIISKANKRIRESLVLTTVKLALARRNPTLLEPGIQKEIEKKKGLIVPWKKDKKGYVRPLK